MQAEAPGEPRLVPNPRSLCVTNSCLAIGRVPVARIRAIGIEILGLHLDADGRMLPPQSSNTGALLRQGGPRGTGQVRDGRATLRMPVTGTDAPAQPLFRQARPPWRDRSDRRQMLVLAHIPEHSIE